MFTPEEIAEKFESIKEGVKAVMGGRVLEYEAKNILNRNMEQDKMELVDIMLKRGNPMRRSQS